jgi:hypothetical protein
VWWSAGLGSDLFGEKGNDGLQINVSRKIVKDGLDNVVGKHSDKCSNISITGQLGEESLHVVHVKVLGDHIKHRTNIDTINVFEGGADLPRMFLPRKSFFNQNVYT